MSISVTGNVEYDDGRVYAGLPAGVRPFWARATATCDSSGGYAFMYLELNPGSQETFQSYVQISTWSVSLATAGLDEGVSIGVIQGDYERAQQLGGSVQLAAINPITLGTSIAEAVGSDNQIKMLGRTVKGTPGRIYITAQNTNTKVVTAVVTGLVSDFPIVGIDTVRV